KYMNRNHYRERIDLNKEKCEDIINSMCSLGKHDISDVERMEFCQLQPEFGSLDTGSLKIKELIFMNTPQFLRKLSKRMQENNIKPEIEVFHTGMIQNALKLANEGLIDKPYHFQFVLGADGGMPATPENLLHLLAHIPEGYT